jgi:hypothetical protein
MNKGLYKKSVFHCIFQFMAFKIFQNGLPLYQWHHTILYVKKIQSNKHFSKFNESIIIRYEL